MTACFTTPTIETSIRKLIVVSRAARRLIPIVKRYAGFDKPPEFLRIINTDARKAMRLRAQAVITENVRFHCSETKYI